MKQLRIDRSQWLNGAVTHKLNCDSMLLSNEEDESSGMMCCLGFYSLQYTMQDTIFGEYEPGSLARTFANNYTPIPAWLEALVERIDVEEFDGKFLNFSQKFSNIHSINEIIGANDDRSMSNALREFRIKSLFLQHLNTDVTFVGKYPDLG